MSFPPAAPFWFSDSCRFKSGLDFSVERIGTKSPSLIDTEVPELVWLTVLGELVENLDENLFKSDSFSVSLIGDDSLVLVDSSFWIESTNSCSPSSEMSSKIRKSCLHLKYLEKQEAKKWIKSTSFHQYSWNSEEETTWISLIGWHHKTSNIHWPHYWTHLLCQFLSWIV